jgi:hypothetical protein
MLSLGLALLLFLLFHLADAAARKKKTNAKSQAVHQCQSDGKEISRKII